MRVCPHSLSVLVGLLLALPAWADTPRAPTPADAGLIGTDLRVQGLVAISHVPPMAPAPVTASAVSPGLQCRQAVMIAGRTAGILDHLMSAIAHVESGRRGVDGQIQPWPWSINVEGTDHVFDTREQAMAAVRAFQGQGIRSIDVGCMQVNLMHHPDAFASLEQAFDPAGNAAYAARFLRQLFDQTGSWPKATAAYHSATPELGSAYQLKVASVMAEETREDADLQAHTPATIARMSPAGALMLSNRVEAAHVLPMATTANARGLAAYRAAPIRVATIAR